MKIIKNLLFLLMLGAISINAQVYMGEWLNKVEQDGHTEYARIHFYSEEKSYVKGGTFFTIPADYFTSVPHVQVSIKLHNIKYNPALEFQAFVTYTSPSSVEIRVNKVNFGLIKNFIVEADTNDIIVQFLAYGY